MELHLIDDHSAEFGKHSERLKPESPHQSLVLSLRIQKLILKFCGGLNVETINFRQMLLRTP